MSGFALGKATALSEADSASKAASARPDPAEDADAVPDQATAEKEQEEDDWEPAPTTKRRAATRRGTKDPPAKRGRGGQNRQAVEPDSQDSAEEEEEQQPPSNCAHGLRSRQRRKQLVIEDENLEEDLGLGDGKPAADVRPHSGAATEADVTPAVPPESAVLSNADMEGCKHLNAGPSNSSHQAQTSPPNIISDGNQDTGGADTVEAAHVAEPTGCKTDLGPSDFPLLDAMLQPDESNSYATSGKSEPSYIQPHAERLSAEDHLQTSVDAGQADRGSGKQQEALVSDAPPSAEPDAPPSRAPVKASLRDRVKAFAALRK